MEKNQQIKLLLLGHKGYLGSGLYKNLSFKCDILNKRDVYDNGNIYDYVINCIGNPNLEFSEKNDTSYSNWLVINDIKKCYPSSKIINFSSYYVYDQLGFCNEESNVTEKYNYCKWKLNAEKDNSNGINFRIGKLFGNIKKRQNKLTDYIIDNVDKEISLDNVLFNPTSINQIIQIILYEFEHKTLFGTYNLSNLGFTSHYEYGIFISKCLNLNIKINQINIMKREFENYGKFLMDTTKINNIYPLVSWENDLIDYLEQV
jgi:dTDP-4-dehydrorhamnose reductase